jgi:hypothetical protein
MSDEDVLDFCVVEADCDQCHAGGPLFRITTKPLDGGDWPTRLTLCESCLTQLSAALARNADVCRFRRGE